MSDSLSPEVDAIWDDLSQNWLAVLHKARELEQERNKARKLNEWNVQQVQILHEGLHKACAEFKHLRDAAVENLRELNDRLIERRESLQAQLIRVETTWREKLKKKDEEIQLLKFKAGFL